MRALLVAATLVVAGSLTAGCGGGGSDDAAPAAATTEEFCAAYNSLFESFSAAEPPSDKESVKALKDWSAEMKQTGTPEDMPEDAQRGFDLVIDTVSDVSDDATQADIQALSDDFSDEEKTDSEAFGKYATRDLPDADPEPALGVRERRVAQTTWGVSPVSLTIGRPAAAQSTIPPSRLMASQALLAQLADRLGGAAADPCTPPAAGPVGRSRARRSGSSISGMCTRARRCGRGATRPARGRRGRASPRGSGSGTPSTVTVGSGSWVLESGSWAHFNSLDSRRSANGFPPVWQVGQYCRLESANDTSRTTSPHTGQVSPGPAVHGQVGLLLALELAGGQPPGALRRRHRARHGSRRTASAARRRSRTWPA